MDNKSPLNLTISGVCSLKQPEVTMRTRSKSDATYLPSTVEESFNSPCGTGWAMLETNQFYSKVGEVKTMIDVSTPGFHRRKARGEIIFSPLTIIRKEVVYSPGSGGFMTTNPTVCGASGPQQRRVDPYHWAFVIARSHLLSKDSNGLFMANSLPTLVSESDINSATREATVTALANVRSGDAQGLESLAQAKQALNLLLNPLSGVSRLSASFFKSLQSRKSSLGKSLEVTEATTRAVAGEWLKYRYGVLPLINDIKAVMKALAAEPRKVRETSRGNASLHAFTSSTAPAFSGVWGFTYRRDDTSTILVRALSLDEYFTSFTSDLGLSLDQIPRTAWNLIPFSFVVDWFVGVDDFITAFVPKAGVTHLGGCVTITRHNVCVVSVIGCVPNGASGPLITVPTGTYTVIEQRKTRTVGLNRPSLEVKSNFRFDVPTRVADASALIVQNHQRIGHLLSFFKVA